MRRVLGTAHTSPGWQACAGRKIRRPAKNRATRAPAIKNGRYGSSNVRFPIHAPLKPRATKTRGPRQQVDARMAAKPPTRSSPEPVRSEPLLAVSTFTWHSPICCCLFLSKLGNERIAYAVRGHICAEPTGVRAPTFEDQRVCVVHQLASHGVGAEQERRVARESLAYSRGP